MFEKKDKVKLTEKQIEIFNGMVEALYNKHTVVVISLGGWVNFQDIVRDYLKSKDVDPEIILKLKEGLKKRKEGFKILDGVESKELVKINRIIDNMINEIDNWLIKVDQRS